MTAGAAALAASLTPQLYLAVASHLTHPSLGNLGIGGWTALAALLVHAVVPFSNSLVVHEDTLLVALLVSVVVARGAQAVVNGGVSPLAVGSWAALALGVVRAALLFATCREERGDGCDREIEFFTRQGGQQALNAAAAVLLVMHDRQHHWFAKYHNLEGGARHRMQRYAQLPLALAILSEWTLEYLQGEAVAAASLDEGGDGGADSGSGGATRLQQLSRLLKIDFAHPLVRTLAARLAFAIVALGLAAFVLKPACVRVERRLKGSEAAILAHGVPSLFTAGAMLVVSTMYSLAALLLSPLAALGLSLAFVLGGLLLHFQAACHGGAPRRRLLLVAVPVVALLLSTL